MLVQLKKKKCNKCSTISVSSYEFSPTHNSRHYEKMMSVSQSGSSSYFLDFSPGSKNCLVTASDPALITPEDPSFETGLSLKKKAIFPQYDDHCEITEQQCKY